MEQEAPGVTNAENMTRAPGGSRGARNTGRRRRKIHKTYSKRWRKRKPEEMFAARVRRGAVIPGTRAHRHPNDPDPVEPFSITIEEGGVITMELVAHQGRSKRAYRTAVPGKRVEQERAAEWMEGGARGERRAEAQSGVRATEERKGEGEMMEGGKARRGWGSPPEAFSRSRQDELSGTGRGGGHSGRNKRRNKCGGERKVHQGFGYLDGGRMQNNDIGNGDNLIAMVVAEEDALDGVHGAPVFLGGQLFGFAIQVCCRDCKKIRNPSDDLYSDKVVSVVSILCGCCKIPQTKSVHFLFCAYMHLFTGNIHRSEWAIMSQE